MILDTDKLQGDDEYRNECRHRFITDHFFAADVLGHKRFVRRLHEPAVKLYFPKNPNISIEEQHPKKKRLHIDPRKTFKTTLGRVDNAQWVAAFPEDITILNESATQPLAAEISAAIARYFWRPKGTPSRVIHLMFPELAFDKKPDGKWSTANHNILDLDATLDFTSPQSQQSGWHPWVLCPDDMVDTKNSGIHASADSRRGVIDTYDTNLNTLRSGGYVNIRGTRYHPADLYGKILDEYDPREWEILIRGSMIVKDGRRLLPGEFPEPDEVELVFPELLGYDELRSMFISNYESFMCQQQNDPQGGSVPTFDEDLYKSILCYPDRVPIFGDTFICWRLPYGGKDFMADYAEGAAVRINGGRVYVIDAWRGIYTPSRLAEKIVRECKRHQTALVTMEAIPGTEYIEAHIRNEGYRKNVNVRIQWTEFEEDDNVRHTRIAQLEPQMGAGRIAISTAIQKAAELRRQLLYFGIVPENGIVDCVSRLAAKIPVSVMREEIDEEEAELHRRRREDHAYDMAFGQMGIQAVEDTTEAMKQAAHDFAMERTNSFGLPDILGGLDG